MLNYLSTKYIVVVPDSRDKLTRLEIIYFYSLFDKGRVGDFIVSPFLKGGEGDFMLD